MSETTTSVVIQFNKPEAQPPIYVAGSFSSWQPQEMEVSGNSEHELKFSKKVDVEEGKEYQYKFRIGDGNWWELDETAPTVTDESGNRNNLLAVPTKAPSEDGSTPNEDSTEEKVESSSIPADSTEEPTMEVSKEPSATESQHKTTHADEATAPTSIANDGADDTLDKIIDVESESAPVVPEQAAAEPQHESTDKTDEDSKVGSVEEEAQEFPTPAEAEATHTTTEPPVEPEVAKENHEETKTSVDGDAGVTDTQIAEQADVDSTPTFAEAVKEEESSEPQDEAEETPAEKSEHHEANVEETQAEEAEPTHAHIEPAREEEEEVPEAKEEAEELPAEKSEHVEAASTEDADSTPTYAEAAKEEGEVSESKEEAEDVHVEEPEHTQANVEEVPVEAAPVDEAHSTPTYAEAVEEEAVESKDEDIPVEKSEHIDSNVEEAPIEEDSPSKEEVHKEEHSEELAGTEHTPEIADESEPTQQAEHEPEVQSPKETAEDDLVAVPETTAEKESDADETPEIPSSETENAEAADLAEDDADKNIAQENASLQEQNVDQLGATAPTTTDNEEADIPATEVSAHEDASTPLAENPEPDHVTLRKEATTPDVAAEVADTAEFLDREPPTPPMSDEDAGEKETRYRRMSYTTLSETASTAAEVADTAEKLDEQTKPTSIELPAAGYDITKDADDLTPDSGLETPSHERVPLFPHECNGPSLEAEQNVNHAPVSSAAPVYHEFDPNDPSIEPFPNDYNGIMDHVQRLENRLPEDLPTPAGLPSESAVASSHSGDASDFPLSSPEMSAHHKSPSMDSIAEEQGSAEEQDKLTQLDEETSEDTEEKAEQAKSADAEASVQVEDVDAAHTREPSLSVPGRKASKLDVQHEIPNTPLPEDKQLTNPTIKKLSTGEGPTINVQPATPESSLNTQDDPMAKASTTKSTSFAEGTDDSQLRARKPASKLPERSITPTSLHSVGGTDAKSRNFLKAFFQVVFVDWIGGLIRKLCGGGRHTLLAVSATLVVIIAPAMYFLS